MKSLIRDLTTAFRYRRFVENPWTAATARKSGEAGALVPLSLRARGKLWIRSVTSDIHVFKDVYLKDAYSLEALAKLGPQPLDRVIEIGGHIGVFATRIATMAGSVLSCEPTAENADLFRKNVDSLACTNVTLLQRAVTGNGESLTVYKSGNNAGHSAYGELAGSKADSFTVEAVTLRDLIFHDGDDNARCDFLKIDCEGGEYDILLTADDSVLSRIARVALEYHNVPYGDHDAPHRALVARLESSGFTVQLRESTRHPSYGYIQAWRGNSWEQASL